MNSFSTNPSDGTVEDNPTAKRFELQLDGKLSFVAYQKRDDDTLVLTHTEVHPDLEGQGVGSRLVKEVLGLVKQNGQNVIPLCPFVTAYLRRHPEEVAAVVHPTYRKLVES